MLEIRPAQEIIRPDSEWQKRMTSWYEQRTGFYGSDIRMGGESATIKPDTVEFIPVYLDQEYIPSPGGIVDLPATDTPLPFGINISIRSRAAQVGLEARSLFVLPENKQDGEKKSRTGVKAMLEVANLGSRAVEINEGDGIARIFSTKNAKRYNGNELKTLLDSGQIKIDGEQGKTWDYVGDNFQTVSSIHKAKGIKLKVSPHRLKVAEGDQEQDPKAIAVLGDGVRDYRVFLEKENVLVPITNKEESHEEKLEKDRALFWVSETEAKVYIAPGISGVMDPIVQIGKHYADHLYSHLISGGSTDWRIRVEVSEHGLNHRTKYDDTWVIINFYEEPQPAPSSQYPVDLFEPSGILLPDAMRIALTNSVALLRDITKKERLLAYKLRVVVFSPSSRDKRIASLLGIRKGIVPLLPEDRNPFRPIEIDPRTGYIDAQSYSDWVKAVLAMRTFFGDNVTNIEAIEEVREYLSWFPQSNEFIRLPLQDKVEWQAVLKALQNTYINFYRIRDSLIFNNCVLATDVMGEVPTEKGPIILTKTDDIDEQFMMLKAIAESGVIYGSVGVAFGEVKARDFMVPDLSQRFNLQNDRICKTNHLNFRIHVDMGENDINRYIKEAQMEIKKSGLVLDAFGPIGHTFITRIEVEDPSISSGWRTVSGLEAWRIVTGYPINIIRDLIEAVKDEEIFDPKYISSWLETAASNYQYILDNPRGAGL